MGPPRFFAPLAEASGSTIELPDDEAAHLTRVLRLKAGDELRVFNGRGREWIATIDQANKQIVRVTLNEAVEPTHEPRVAITLAAALLKGDKMDDVVRDAVMLGVAAIQPLITARTEISPTQLARSARIARWQRIAVASAKQCGRAVVPEVRQAVLFAALVDAGERLVMLIEPGNASAARPLRELTPLDRATLVIGPEGGWTAEEVERAAASGAMLVTLGGHTLRADATPLVALTALRVHWGDL